MNWLLLTIGLTLSGCQVTNPQALKWALDDMRSQQQHQDRMRATNRLPYAPSYQPTYQNSYQPVSAPNPYYRTPGQNTYQNPYNVNPYDPNPYR